MATRLELRNRVKGHLGSALSSLYSDPTLDLWLDEGVRQCSPVYLNEVEGAVTGVSGTARSFSSPIGCLYVMRAYVSGVAFPGWRQFGSKVRLDKAIGGVGPYTVALEYLAAWGAMGSGDSAVCPLPDYSSDLPVLYAVYSAFWALANGRMDYRKYATVAQNNVDLTDVEALAGMWQERFEKRRLEVRTRRQILFERERQGGGAQVVGSGDVR